MEPEPTHSAKLPHAFKGQAMRPPVPPLYRFFATGLGASMWFFLMYRAKKDGPVFLGWRHPWDH
ncbi:NADH dehydrogenase [ubiquinone] 1 beta subcomplex subunit 2 [Cytospora mali]|uniref:NADH dehydrogenase [ubiquinone] 1 beta subcomplex subunit 2 n=1 Tax=Cytospora mali TaxID=578113 RepID=A0A194V4J6_CYTMA|nr:NADH dehydrogenase [ubiquinone] 1 beta subcomplex subunit 2 [Valsa mali var. pyri (nom. inval.)]